MLVIGLKNTERFSAISAFAPIVSASQVPWGIKAFSTYLGEDQATWRAWDASELIKEMDTLPILIMQGTKDKFYPEQLDEASFLKIA